MVEWFNYINHMLNQSTSYKTKIFNDLQFINYFLNEFQFKYILNIYTLLYKLREKGFVPVI